MFFAKWGLPNKERIAGFGENARKTKWLLESVEAGAGRLSQRSPRKTAEVSLHTRPHREIKSSMTIVSVRFWPSVRSQRWTNYSMATISTTLATRTRGVRSSDVRNLRGARDMSRNRVRFALPSIFCNIPFTSEQVDSLCQKCARIRCFSISWA